jgi:uncharacterized membrane protein YoaK (UPF0700 family)
MNLFARLFKMPPSPPSEFGNPGSGGASNIAILEAVNALAEQVGKLELKVNTMSGNLTQAEADIAALTTANTQMAADLAAITTLIQGLTAGTTLTQADIDALHAAAGAATTNTAAAGALVPPATPSP